jgi:geranylgeranyl pyrophosphate synthase
MKHLRTAQRYLLFRSTIDSRIEDAVCSVEPPMLREAVEHALRGGKRVRPLVTLLACSAAGGEYRSAAAAATAIELLHTSSLVHDDLMDASTLRRGAPTLHTVYDVPTTILAGDTLVALAFQAIQGIHAGNAALIQRLFAGAFRELCEGQGYDLCLLPDDDRAVDLHERLVEKKTSSLFRAAAEIGALHATDDDPTVQALGRFGHHLGMAFQAHDDLLDVSGDEAIMGKPAFLDRRNGRSTYVSIANAIPARGVVQRHTESAVHALLALDESGAREDLIMLARSLEARDR